MQTMKITYGFTMYIVHVDTTTKELTVFQSTDSAGRDYNTSLYYTFTFDKLYFENNNKYSPYGNSDYINISGLLIHLGLNIYVYVNYNIHVFQTDEHIVQFEEKIGRHIFFDHDFAITLPCPNHKHSIYDNILQKNINLTYLVLYEHYDLKQRTVPNIIFDEKYKPIIPHMFDLLDTHMVFCYMIINVFLQNNNIVLDKFVKKYILKLYSQYTILHNILLQCPQLDKTWLN